MCDRTGALSSQDLDSHLLMRARRPAIGGELKRADGDRSHIPTAGGRWKRVGSNGTGLGLLRHAYLQKKDLTFV